MHIQVAFLPQMVQDVAQSVCIVVDVLRATTVVATLFERGCPCVYVAPSHELARAFARRNGYVLCGETDGFKVPDFDHGNSPTEIAATDFTGRPVVLSTTNGTRAVAAVMDARCVYLGAAVNRMAVAQAAWQRAQETRSDIVIVCSGTNGQFTLEDATVAGMYVEALAAQGGPWNMPEQADSAIAARRLWEREPNLLRGWMEGHHARALAERGFGEDIGYSAGTDILPHVPTLVSEAEIGTVAAPVVLIS